MAKRSIPQEKIQPTLSAERAIELIKRQINQIEGLLELRYDDPEVKKWDNITEQILVKAFGRPNDNLSYYHNARHLGSFFFAPGSDDELQRDFEESMGKGRKLLEGFVEQLEMFAEPVEGNQRPKVEKLSKKIFIVHGHDEQAKTELALILTRLGFEPIILHEQPSEGMTVIEKLEKHLDVGFAFVLLTPDDVGESVENKDNLKPRARQNVVFEFGLFVGKLGRDRVRCLYKGGVELPSDLQGLVYFPFNSSVNEIQLDIVKELRAAGYKVEI